MHMHILYHKLSCDVSGNRLQYNKVHSLLKRVNYRDRAIRTENHQPKTKPVLNMSQGLGAYEQQKTNTLYK